MESVNSFSTEHGNPIMAVLTGDHKGDLVSVAPQGQQGNLGKEFQLKNGELTLILPSTGCAERAVEYIGGPSGSGKSTVLAKMIKLHLKVFPKAKVFLFSRSRQEDDPAFKGIKFRQVKIDDTLVTDPIDVTIQEEGSILVFDDIGTIHSDAQRRAVEKIIMDALEVGRKFRISVIVTSHLIIPNDKKFARVVMNEIQYLTVFPQSGTSQSITYALKEYFGMGKNEVDKILKLPSRWVTIHTRFPRFVMYDRGAYFL